MPRYLLDEYPILVYPSLAKAVGLNEAIVLQKLHGWLAFYEDQPTRHTDHLQEGRYWVWGTPEYWSEQIPFLSGVTIRRALTTLRELGIVVTGIYNAKSYDRTLWYSIDYAAYERIIETKRAEWQANPDAQLPDDDPSDQIDQMVRSNRPDPSDQIDQMDVINLTTPIPISSTKRESTTQRRRGAIAPPPQPSLFAPDPEQSTDFSNDWDCLLRDALRDEARAAGRRGPTAFESMAQKGKWRDAASAIVQLKGEVELQRALQYALEQGRTSRASVINTVAKWAENLIHPPAGGNGKGRGKTAVMNHEQYEEWAKRNSVEAPEIEAPIPDEEIPFA